MFGEVWHRASSVVCGSSIVRGVGFLSRFMVGNLVKCTDVFEFFDLTLNLSLSADFLDLRLGKIRLRKSFKFGDSLEFLLIVCDLIVQELGEEIVHLWQRLLSWGFFGVVGSFLLHG